MLQDITLVREGAKNRLFMPLRMGDILFSWRKLLNELPHIYIFHPAVQFFLNLPLSILFIFNLYLCIITFPLMMLQTDQYCLFASNSLQNLNYNKHIKNKIGSLECNIWTYSLAFLEMEFLSPKFTTHKEEKKLKVGLAPHRWFGNVLQLTTATLEFTVGVQTNPWKSKGQTLAHISIGRTHGY